MKGFTKMMIVVVLFSGMVSCGDDTNENPIDDAIKKAQESFDGEIVKSYREKDDGKWVIKIEMLNKSLASVEFEYLEKDISLIEVKGEKGPFDYDVTLEDGLIDFQQAKEIAVNEVGNSLENDKMDSWSLEQDDDFNHKWVYDFEFNIPDKDVYIDAKNGNVLGTDS
jgi:uncharacterized membrane protein YkoI